jgi:hypothetical protein
VTSDKVQETRYERRKKKGQYRQEMRSERKGKEKREERLVAKDKRRVIMDERIVRGFKRRGRKERGGSKIKRRPFQNKNFYQRSLHPKPPHYVLRLRTILKIILKHT